MRFILSALLLASASSLSSACLTRRDGSQTDWSYEGRTGPLLWHNLAEENAICATGKYQSPINIDATIKTITGSTFNYPSEGDFVLENDGHTIDATVADTRLSTKYTATLGGVEYQLVGFHFHSPSEHRVNGIGYPLEAHFVHQNVKSGDLAVFGVFFDIARRQGDSFLNKMPFRKLSQKGDKKSVKNVDLSSIIRLVSTSKVFNYSGSLTTPPCSEKVDWFVGETPLSISAAQYNDIKTSMGFNSRYTQSMPGEENLLQRSCGLN